MSLIRLMSADVAMMNQVSEEVNRLCLNKPKNNNKKMVTNLPHFETERVLRGHPLRLTPLWRAAISQGRINDEEWDKELICGTLKSTASASLTADFRQFSPIG